MARDLRRDGCRLDVFVYAEVRDWLTHYFRSWAQARRDRGLAVPIAELKGPGRAMARNIAWLCSLCDEDIERIQLEGEGLIAAMDRQPADYGKVPGRLDAVAIPRRTRSILIAGSRSKDPHDAFDLPADSHGIGSAVIAPKRRGDVDEPIAEPVPHPRLRRPRRV